MVIGLVVVDVMDCQFARRIAFWQPTQLALPVISRAGALLEFLCELKGVCRCVGTRQTTSHPHAFTGAINAFEHVGADEPSPNLKLFATLLADECAHTSKTGGMITGIRAKSAAPIRCLTWLGKERLAALLAYALDLLAPECLVTLTRAEHMLLSPGMMRSAMNQLAAHLTGFIPAIISTSARAKTSLAGIDLVFLRQKRPITRFADTLYLARPGDSITGIGTILAFGSWGSIERMTANEATVNHDVSSVRDNVRMASGRRVRRPGLSVSDQLTLARM